MSKTCTRCSGSSYVSTFLFLNVTRIICALPPTWFSCWPLDPERRRCLALAPVGDRLAAIAAPVFLRLRRNHRYPGVAVQTACVPSVVRVGPKVAQVMSQLGGPRPRFVNQFLRTVVPHLTTLWS